MMVNTPEYVRKLIDKIVPWIEVDLEHSDFYLRVDAPQDVKDAQKKLDEYTEKHRYPLGFEE